MRGARQTCSKVRKVPYCHHVLLSRHPVWVVLHCRHHMAPLMAGLLTCGSTFSRTFPSLCRLSGIHRGHSPLTVAGAVTGLAPFGYSSPYSLFIPNAFSAVENHQKCLEIFQLARQVRTFGNADFAQGGWGKITSIVALQSSPSLQCTGLAAMGRQRGPFRGHGAFAVKLIASAFAVE